MDNPPPPNISSFIIRFVVNIDTSATLSQAQPSQYYGAIRHIQSDQEINFVKWEEAENFIARFVEIKNHIKNE